MKDNWLTKKQIDDCIGLVTNCFNGIHPELSMLTSKEFYCDDKIFLAKLAKSILSGNMKYYDHYLFFGNGDYGRDVLAFIIKDPGDETRFRVVKTQRPFYTKSIEIVI